MNARSHHGHGGRDFRIALASSLAVITILFLLPLGSGGNTEKTFLSTVPPITIIDIPRPPATMQRNVPPARALQIISVPSLDMLPDLVDGETIPTAASAFSPPGRHSPGKPTGEAQIAGAGSFLPRQILEVLPAGDDRCRGTATVLIGIGRDGVPRSHRIRSNSMPDPSCLRDILEAVYASRWEPFPASDRRDSMIVRKSYTFE